jgi:hypothetical protein
VNLLDQKLVFLIKLSLYFFNWPGLACLESIYTYSFEKSIYFSRLIRMVKEMLQRREGCQTRDDFKRKH